MRRTTPHLTAPLAGLLLGAIGVLLAAAPVTAAPRPSNPQGATVALAATTVQAGTTIRFTGTGWVNAAGRGQVVTIKLDDVDILRTVTATDGGAVSGTVTVPKATKTSGTHWLRLLAGSGAENDGPSRSLASAEFTVTAAAGGAAPATTGTGTPTTAGTLPKTGIDAGPWLAATIALPVAGIALLVADRRRRRAAPAAR
jgi:LPXTG-motif cell wall-anchored protein